MPLSAEITHSHRRRIWTESIFWSDIAVEPPIFPWGSVWGPEDFGDAWHTLLFPTDPTRVRLDWDPDCGRARTCTRTVAYLFTYSGFPALLFFLLFPTFFPPLLFFLLFCWNSWFFLLFPGIRRLERSWRCWPGGLGRFSRSLPLAKFYISFESSFFARFNGRIGHEKKWEGAGRVA